MYYEGSINSEVFETFISDCLCPNLKSFHHVILDNVAFHKIATVEKLIQEKQARIIYLPPYSPELSPIELMWSKIKSVLRKWSVTSTDHFRQAIKAAFEAVNTQDLEGWFQHCGY